MPTTETGTGASGPILRNPRSGGPNPCTGRVVLGNPADRPEPQFPHPENGATFDSQGCTAGERTPRTAPGPQAAQEGTCCSRRPWGRVSYRSAAPGSEEKPAAEGRSRGARRPPRPQALPPPAQPGHRGPAGSERDAAGCPRGPRRALGPPGWRRRVQRARPERPRPGTRLQPARARRRLPALRAPPPPPAAPPTRRRLHSRRAPRVPATLARGSARRPTLPSRAAAAAESKRIQPGGGERGAESAPDPPAPRVPSPRDPGRARGRGGGEAAAGWPPCLPIERLLGAGTC